MHDGGTPPPRRRQMNHHASGNLLSSDSMKRGVSLLYPALLCGAALLARADATDDAMVAAMKFSTTTTYSWAATLNQNSHDLEIHGKTSVGSYSLVTFVGYASAGGGASTASSSAGGGVNAVFLGDNKFVVQSNGNWVNPGNVSPPSEQSDPGNQNTAGSGGSSGKRGGRNRGMGGGMGTSGQRGRSSGGTRDSSSATGSPKLPSGINLPHEQLAIVAANYAEIHLEGGVVNGKLTESAAGLLLLPPGSMQAPPEKAAGTFRLWTTDGTVTKYELKLTAATGPGGASVKGGLSETITVELTDVGTTTVEVPPAARIKLGG
jgi:hypothetical protein